MIQRSFDIEKYGWHVDFFFAITHYEPQPIIQQLQRINVGESILQRVQEKMAENKIDTGFTYSNARKRSSVVVIGKASSGAEFLNSFTHELRHLTDDIAREEQMPIAGEEAAYLTGDIALKTADIVCHFSCDCCRKKS